MNQPSNSFYNLEAERSLIGIAVNTPEKVKLITALHSDDFYLESHKILHQCVCALEKEKRAVDLITMEDWLSKKGLMEKAGGIEYLIQCATEGFPGSAKSYVDIVHECAMNRALYTLGTELRRKTQEGGDPNEVREWAARMIREVRLGDQIHLIDMQEACQTTYSALEAEQGVSVDESGNPSMGAEKTIDTGITVLDQRLGRLRAGMYVAIGARPGVGKSILTLQICVNAAKKGKRVLLVSLEMSEVEITERVLADAGNVQLSRITSCNIPVDTWMNLAQAIGKVCNLPLYYSRETYTVEDVRRAAYQLYENGGIDLIAIDYLQLMEATYAKRQNRQEQIAEISRGLKRLAQELGVPILVLTQLNRSSEKVMDKGKKVKREPTMSEARESGSIEQDANVFILLHDPKENELEGEFDLNAFEKAKAYGMTMMRIIVDKNRQGKRGRVTVAFDGDHMRFVPIEKIGERQG